MGAIASAQGSSGGLQWVGPLERLRRLPFGALCCAASTCTPHARVGRAAAVLAAPNRHHLQQLHDVLLSSFPSLAYMCSHIIQIIRSIAASHFSPLSSLRQASSIENIGNSDILFALFTRIRSCVLPQPCRIPPNPGSLAKRTLARHPPRLSTKVLLSTQNPKSVVSRRHGREKIVSSISQPQSAPVSCAASLPDQPRVSPRLATSASAVPTLFLPTRFKLEKQKGKSPASNFATRQSPFLVFFACFHSCFFIIYLFTAR